MPELPEVEVVRRGLDPYLRGRVIEAVEVPGARAVRRQAGGADGLRAGLVGRRFRHASRRGKYLWLPLAEPGAGDRARAGDQALVVHLGMSGQLLLPEREEPAGSHLRARIGLARAGRDLRFVDQRTFGGLFVDDLVPDDAGGCLPASVAHIARDPLDPRFDEAATIGAIRRRHSGIKRILLDQGVVSGVGNIYADESLWRARLHYDRPGDSVPAPRLRELLAHVRDVMSEALAQGGTSFDSLYVNVNGESGWFDRDLAAYGRAGEPCARCGAAIVREPFMNRSSFRCPRCQRRPAGASLAVGPRPRR